MPDVIFPALAWIAWCALHSLLLSHPVQGFAKSRLGRKFAFYRLSYNALSIIALLPVLWWQFTSQHHLMIEPNLPLRLAQVFLLGYGLLMFVLGARAYDMSYFLGLAQWRNYRRHRQPPEQPIATSGILAHVRHPWYSGGIALLWSIGPYTDVSLGVRIVLTAYLILGTLHEEYRLRRQYGQIYRAYSRRVPMLIPRLKT